MQENENTLFNTLKNIISAVSNKKSKSSPRKKENEKDIKRYELEYITLGICIVVDYIASAISCCDINIYKDKKNYINPLYYKLNNRPNPNYNAATFKYETICDLLLKGEAMWIPYNNNLYKADTFYINKRSLDGNTYTGISSNKIGIPGIYRADELFIFKLNNGKITRLLNSFGPSYREFVSKAFYKYISSGGEKYKYKIDSGKAGDPGFQNEWEEVITKDLEEFLSKSNAVIPEYEGYDLVSLSKNKEVNIDTAEPLKVREDSFKMVADAFHVPIAMITGNVSNLNEVVNTFFNFSVLPITNMIDKEITSKYFSSYDVTNNGIYAKTNLSNAKYRDLYDYADNASKVLSSSLQNANEIRKDFNRPPLNDEFAEKYWMTRNNSKVEDLLNQADMKGGDNNE